MKLRRWRSFYIAIDVICREFLEETVELSVDLICNH